MQKFSQIDVLQMVIEKNCTILVGANMNIIIPSQKHIINKDQFEDVETVCIENTEESSLVKEPIYFEIANREACTLDIHAIQR